ncbi:MAG: hypothetical protein IT190_09245, partial [Microbacteriaceae bacterium]|nr:hypothetical protein [Microbacteriaceae bacterium]
RFTGPGLLAATELQDGASTVCKGTLVLVATDAIGSRIRNRERYAQPTPAGRRVHDATMPGDPAPRFDGPVSPPPATQNSVERRRRGLRLCIVRRQDARSGTGWHDPDGSFRAATTGAALH